MTNDTRTRFTFRVPQDLYDKLKIEAEEMGVSLNSLILKILWEWEEEEDRV